MLGRPTLVHFWSINSPNSQTNMSQIAELRDRRKREGLRVIAVHVPHIEGLTGDLSMPDDAVDARRVRDAVARLNLTEPCALDHNYQIRDAFRNGQEFAGSNIAAEESVPAYFLFDHEGKLRSFASGTGGLETIEDQLDQLLAELRNQHPFCPACEWFLNEEALFCADCGLPLALPSARGVHPYYEHHHSASLPTVRLVNPDPLIGQKIDGRYELLARLGEGSMSVVYRARRVHIGDIVAVKVLLAKLLTDDVALARFRREARAAAMVHHANVITIHD